MKAFHHTLLACASGIERAATVEAVAARAMEET